MRFSALQTAEQWFSAPLFERVRPFAERIDSGLTGKDDASKAQRTSLIAFFIRVLSAVIAFLSQVILARLMGPFEYGVFVLVWVAMVIIGGLAPLGFQTAIIRFLPQYYEQNDFPRIRGMLVSSRIFVLLFSSLVAVLTVGVVYFGAEWFESYLILPFIVGAIALPMIAFGDMLDGTARAQGWPVRALGPTYILRPLLILAFLVVAWALGYSIDGVTALLCAVAATYITSVIQFFIIDRNLDLEISGGSRTIELGYWLRVAFPIFLVEGFFFLLVNADILMVGLLMTPADVGVYYATAKTIAVAHFVFFAVKAGVANLFAARIYDADQSALRDLAQRSAVWSFWPTLFVSVAIVLAGPLLLALFGETFTDGYPLMFIMVAGVVLRSSIGPAESLLNMSGNQNICAAVYGIVLVTNIALNFALIPLFGLYGAAWATTIATLLETLALYYVVRSRLGVSMFVFIKTKDEVEQ
ncbi:MAG: polysaccharide biosynthesis C-terminal domain-containing protein [Pseudomonadota bacterium]